MKKLLVIALIAVLVTSCTPKPEQIASYLAQTLTAWPTQTAYPTYTPENTYTPYPTLTPPNTSTPIIKIITATYTATPLFTATNTLIPTKTPIPSATPRPTATADPLKKAHKAGFYLIGVDIATGVWRNNGTGDRCYWAVTSKTGDIYDNHFGMAGGTAYVPAYGYQVEFGDGCGLWTWISD